MESVRVILEALRTGDAGLAQRTVDAEVKKDPKSDVYLALKVHVYSRLLDRKTAVEAAKEAVKYCSKKTLEMFLVPALCDYHESELITAAFQRVDRLVPHDSNVRELWLEVALELGDLPSAQKALMAKQRDLAGDEDAQRVNVFSACVVMALSDPANKLFPMLSARMIDSVLPAKTPQECFVAALVRKMTSIENMVNYLENEELKPFLAGSLELQQLLLDGMLKCERWNNLFEYAKAQLEKIDSFNYWEALNISAVKLGKFQEAEEYCSRFSSVNSKLAAIDLLSKANKDIEPALQDYWSKYGDRQSTAQFLKKYVTPEQIMKLSKDTLGTKLNVIKLTNPTAVSVPELVQLYEQHKDEVPAEKTEYFIGSDALLLCLPHLNREEAIVLMEHALAADPYNFYVKLALIELYNSLGLTALAQPHFEALSIKNIQYETLGFLLSTRIGTVSPQESKRVFDKLGMARRRIPNFGTVATSALLRSAYTQFDGVFKLGDKLTRSLGAALLRLETIKAARCTRGSVDMGDLVNVIEPESCLLDNRDFVTRFGGGPVASVGPVQYSEYVAVQRAKELAVSEYSRSGTTTDISSFVERANQSAEFTEIEKWNVAAVSSMLSQQSVPQPPAFDSKQDLDWSFFHWAYTLLETSKVAKLIKQKSVDANALIKEPLKHYMNTLNEREQQFVAKAKTVPGEQSKYARLVRNEHLRKLQELQKLI